MPGQDDAEWMQHVNRFTMAPEAEVRQTELETALAFVYANRHLDSMPLALVQSREDTTLARRRWLCGNDAHCWIASCPETQPRVALEFYQHQVLTLAIPSPDTVWRWVGVLPYMKQFLD